MAAAYAEVSWPESDSQFLVKAGLLIDGTGAKPMRDMGILVEGDKIAAVDKFVRLTRPDRAVADLAGATVMPGFIDLHSHVSFTMTSPRTPYAEIADPIDRLAIRAASHMRQKLFNGVTTVRAMSERTHVAATLREAIRWGVTDGPDMLVAGRGIRVSHGWGHTAIECVGEDEIRRLIRDNLAHGADVTKVFLTNNAAPGPGGSIPSYFTEAEVAAIVDESHQAGIPVAAHCHGGAALERFVRFGGDTIEHGFFLDERDLELMTAQGTWLVGTIGYLYDRVDPSVDPDAEAARAVVGDLYRQAILGGVRFALGTDDGVEGIGHELACLVRQGVDPARAVQAATRDAALCLGREDRGRLTAGLRADIVAVAGDPTHAPHAFEEVVLVLKAGRRAYWDPRRLGSIQPSVATSG